MTHNSTTHLIQGMEFDNYTSLINTTDIYEPSTTNRIVVFLLYFFFGLVGTLLYVVLFFILIKHRRTFKGSFYKFLLCLAVAETYGLLYYGFYAPFCTLLVTCPVDDLSNNILTVLSWVSYFTEFPFHVAIAVDRFVAICFCQYYESLFSRKVIFVIVTVGWTFCFAMSTPFVSDMFTYSYIQDQYTDYYVNQTDASDMYDQIQFGICVSLLCISGLFYIVTVMKLFCSKRQNSAVQTAQQKLMIQAVVHFTFIFSYLLLFEFIPDVGTVWINVAATLMFQGICLSTTILTFAMNGTFREKLRETIGQHTRIVPTSTANASVFVRTRATENPVFNSNQTNVFHVVDIE